MNSLHQKPIAHIRLALLANKAAPSPILGQAFGQFGINIAAFCDNFNRKTKNLRGADIFIPTSVTIYNDGTFDVSIKTPSTTALFKKTARFVKGSSMPKKKNLVCNWILAREIYHLGAFKKCCKNSNHLSLKSICKTLIGSAKSMGLPIL